MITKTETRKEKAKERVAKKPIVTLGQSLRTKRTT
tara:strand:- start:2717 stop:2821 length:105 start_codon:yes stop_codon:yes gene_type:complete